MKYTLIACLLLLPVLALAACGDDDDDDDITPTETSAAASETTAATDEPTDAPTASPSASVADVCPENTDPAASDIAVVLAPQPGDTSASPLTVDGQIAAFEAQFNISILAEDGTAIVDNISAMSAEGQTLAPFNVEVEFTVTEETPACLQVYDISEADGTTKTNIVQVPVTLLP